MRAAILALLLGFSVTVVSAGLAIGHTLTIGLSASVTAIDPHFLYTSANIAVSRHFFDPLILQDDEQRLIPGLAESWHLVDETTWEFSLRRGVKFHDGSDFVAADVAYTLNRAANVPNSPGSFAGYIKSITEVTIIDDYTIRLHTAKPNPQLPWDMSTFGIIPHELGPNIRTEDFSRGQAMIGTGPFRFVSWVPGDRLVMARNDRYWRRPSDWDHVVLVQLSNAASRIAALRSGQVDAIEHVPVNDVPWLEQDPLVTCSHKTSNRVIYLQMDTNRTTSPFVSDQSGAAIGANPFKDQRVRVAISKAIDRDTIVKQVMSGYAVPAAQVLPDGYFGVSSRLAPEPYRPEEAKDLLATAGFGEGFRVTLHAASDNYENGAETAQAIAQMLSRIGIAVDVQMMPKSVWSTRAAALEFSFMLASWGSESGEISGPLRGIIASFDREKGWGTSNRGRYSNSAFDVLFEQATTATDITIREQLLREASEFAMKDVAIIPLYFEVAIWAARRGITYEPRSDGYTLAYQFRSSRD